ncbi:MAG: hypothetical protein EBT83_08625, partial [Betaproteobacteria bacterium]|nr:hypothetical protein [Betaproteobacteria bacterium]
MKQIMQWTLAAGLSVTMALAAAQGLPGATVKKDEAGAGKAGATRDAGKDSLRERCKQNPQECEQKKAEFQKRRE